jgi:hypothetical protein
MIGFDTVNTLNNESSIITCKSSEKFITIDQY